MDIGVALPTMAAGYDRSTTLDWSAGIDAGPFSSISCGERITFRNVEMMVTLSAAAALTERVKVFVNLVVAPFHPPAVAAKELATLDLLSDGRVVVGVGVGGREHDYRAISARFDHRWGRMDEQVATMRSIWAGEPPFAGADPVGPPPVQEGGPPFVAGVMGPKALARAARWAVGVDDGGTVFGIDADAVTASFDRVRAAWSDAGRSDPPHLSVSLWYALGDGAADRLRDYGYAYMRIMGEELASAMAGGLSAHTPDALAEAVGTLEELGCDELFLVPTTADVAELDRTRDALARWLP